MGSKKDEEEMDKVCFVCLNPVSYFLNDRDMGYSYRGKTSKEKEDNFTFSSVKILIYYLLQNSSHKNGELDELLTNILSSFSNGKISICYDCLSRAKSLMDLHLELEKIQMQILDVLKGLQDYLKIRKPSIEANFGLEKLRDDAMCSRFRDVLLGQFVDRDLTDGAKVRLKRLETMGFSNFPSLFHPKNVEKFPEVKEIGEAPHRLRRSSRAPVKPIIDEFVNFSDNSDSEFQVDGRNGSGDEDSLYEPNEPDENEDYEMISQPDKHSHSLNPIECLKRASVAYCDICLQPFHHKTINAHLKSHPEFKRFYKCRICSRHLRKFGTFKGLVWHYVSRNHCVQLPCKLCVDQSILFEVEELYKHLCDIHYPDQKKLQCKFEGCFEEFYEPECLRDHEKRQHVEVPHTCDLCQKTFKDKFRLDTHRMTVHTERDRYQCASCPKDFKCLEGLRRHEKTHQEGWVPKPKAKVLIECPQCLKLVSKHRLNVHIQQVHGEKSLLCRFCGKGFTTKKHLVRHEDAHRGEKKYKCSKCSYAGSTTASLESHMRLHREKTFHCRYCPKAFPIKRYWEDHERIHTKEKPFKCEFCDMAFNARNMLSAHHKKKHGITPVQRSLAGVGFIQEQPVQEDEAMAAASVPGDFSETLVKIDEVFI